MKNVKRIIFLFIFVLLLSGCVKNTSTMTISKNKKLTLETEILISDKLKDLNSNILNKEEFSSYGVKLNEVSKNGYSGYSFKKEYKNIDKISGSIDEDIDFNKIYERVNKNNNIFTINKGFLKNTYVARYKYDRNEYNNYDLDEEEDTVEEETETTEIDSSDNEEMSTLNDIANLTSEVEVVFSVKLPYGSSDNNASSNSDGKLTWNLATLDDGEIYFKFDIYNITNIVLVICVGLVAFILVFVLLKIIKNKRVSKPTLIYKECDPSIEDKLYDGKNVIIDRSKSRKKNSLEYTLPEEDTKKQIKKTSKNPKFYDSGKFIDEEIDFSKMKSVKLDVPDAVSITEDENHK